MLEDGRGGDWGGIEHERRDQSRQKQASCSRKGNMAAPILEERVEVVRVRVERNKHWGEREEGWTLEVGG